MFGHDENQQQQGQDNGVLNAAMPAPVANMVNPGSPPPDDQGTVISDGIHPVQASAPAIHANAPATVAQPPMNNDALLSIKQQALQHLSPLVSHLDQTPEEKFRTTMMMIQASDDQTLIKSAFEAAQAITDDKARAQALLDIINEINYFTQHQNQS